VREIITTLLVCFVLAGVANGSEPIDGTVQARIAGGDWRSILPTGKGKPRVRVAPFRLDRTPVTNAQFLAFVRQNPEWRRGQPPAVMVDAGYLKHWQSATQLGLTAESDQPVTEVSWFAARAFCEARGARLPTWYEWEIAAAADESEKDARNRPGWQQRILGWYARPSSHALVRVGTEPPNFYGVHDLHGLVWEWVEDFNALMMSGDSRERGDPDQLKFCGSGAMAFEDPGDYALAMRLALLSSLEAKSTTKNLGFRCASDDGEEGP
jgi:formylglycine-generating enzyme